MGRTWIRTGGAAALVVAAACGGGGGGGGGPGGPNPGGGTGSMSANLDGQNWSSDRVDITVPSAGVPGVVIISGTELNGSDYIAITLTLSYLDGPGTYPLGVNTNSTAGGLGILLEAQGGSVTNWMTPLSGVAGAVTIQTLTATRIAGTFHFAGDPTLGPGLSRLVANGQFDVTLPSALIPVPAGNRGSTTQATFGATLFNGATVLALGDLSAGSFSLVANTVAYSLTMTTTTPVSAGTYTLGSGVNLQVSDLGSLESWGSTSGVTGSVTFTDLSGGRVVGTFSGVLVPLGGGPGSLTVGSGTFDVRVDAAP